MKNRRIGQVSTPPHRQSGSGAAERIGRHSRTDNRVEADDPLPRSRVWVWLLVPRAGFEPARPCGPEDFKSSVSAIPPPRHSILPVASAMYAASVARSPSQARACQLLRIVDQQFRVRPQPPKFRTVEENNSPAAITEILISPYHRRRIC